MRCRSLLFRSRNLRRVRDLLPKLKDVPIVVTDGKLAHAVVEILNGIHNCCFVFDLFPQSINVVGAEVKRTSKRGLVKRLVGIGKGNHYLDRIFS